jgi:hypothetical protein
MNKQPLTDMWENIQHISSIDTQVQHTREKMKRCYFCDKPAVIVKYYKPDPDTLGNFVGYCEEHKELT